MGETGHGHPAAGGRGFVSITKVNPMRLNLMTSNRPRLLRSSLLVVAIATLISMTASFTAETGYAQAAVPPGSGNTFKDTSMFKPPAGAKVAILEFQDLECPACAHAFPIVHAAVAHYNIPLMEKDFPLQQHIWSFDAAIWARYLQDKV